MQNPTGPTVCPHGMDQPGPIEENFRNPNNHNAQPNQQRNVIDIEEPEPECEIRQQTTHKEPTTQPANGNPIPTQQQRDAPKPESYSSDLQKLIVMGYDRQRAENALMAADFNLQIAIQKLHGQ